MTHNNGMLQDLPLSGHHMRMDNDLWPVVRESARRVLRLENILFRTPKKFNEDFKLILAGSNSYKNFKLLSKISISNIIENKKYKPPIH